MKWVSTLLLAAVGCQAAVSPFKLTMALIPHPEFAAEGLYIAALKARNVGDEPANVTLVYNYTLHPLSIPGTYMEKSMELPLDKLKLRTKTADVIAELFDETTRRKGEGKGKGVLVRYTRPPFNVEPEDLIGEIRRCMGSHDKDCGFDQWEDNTQCRPEIITVAKLRLILLDYTNTFADCQPGEIQADVEYINTVMPLSSIRVSRTRNGKKNLLAERLLQGVPRRNEGRSASWPNDPLRNSQWYHDDGKLWGLQYIVRDHGPHFTPRIGIIGSGADLPHEDMMDWATHSREPPVGNHYINWAEYYGQDGVDDDGNGYIDDKHGWTAGLVGQAPFGVSSLGTELGGIIGALWNNGLGIAGLVGFNADIIHCQRYHDVTNRTGDDLDRECFEFMETAGADIIVYDNEWAANSPQTISPDLKAAFDRWAELERPIFMPAGNTNREITCSGTAYSYPACWKYPNHFVVGTYDRAYNKANNCDTGPAIKTLAAGTDILTTVHRYFQPGSSPYAYKSDHRYGAAVMAGWVASLMQARPFMDPYTIDRLFKLTARPRAGAAGTQYGGWPQGEDMFVVMDREQVNPVGADVLMDYARHPRLLLPGQSTTYYFLTGAFPGETPELEGNFVAYHVNGDRMRRVAASKATFNIYFNRTYVFEQTEGLTACDARDDILDIDLNQLAMELSGRAMK